MLLYIESYMQYLFYFLIQPAGHHTNTNVMIFPKDIIITDQQIARQFVHYSECLYHLHSFYVNQIINPFHSSKISANHDKGLVFQPIGKSLYSLIFLQVRIKFLFSFLSLKDRKWRHLITLKMMRKNRKYWKTHFLICQDPPHHPQRFQRFISQMLNHVDL